MQKRVKNPSLTDDLGSLAGLYRTVFWMISRRLRYGRDWEEHLRQETLRLYAPSRPGAPSKVHSHN